MMNFSSMNKQLLMTNSMKQPKQNAFVVCEEMAWEISLNYIMYPTSGRHFYFKSLLVLTITLPIPIFFPQVAGDSIKPEPISQKSKRTLSTIWSFLEVMIILICPLSFQISPRFLHPLFMTAYTPTYSSNLLLLIFAHFL